MDQRTIPDARWINQKLDIRAVAERLGIRTSRGKFHCWRPENHTNGDADPSVAFWEPANRLKCFVCPLNAIGPINLVMEYLQVDFRRAVDWIDENFPVERIPARKPTEREKVRLPVGRGESPMDFFVRSHIYSKLSPASRQLAPALLAFTDPEQGSTYAPRKLTASYLAMMRYSGLRSPNAIKKALEELRIIGWLHPVPNKLNGLVKNVGSYSLTPYSEAVRELANALAIEERQAIEYEKAWAQQRRVERQREFRSKKANEADLLLSQE
jgi:hypothetical protein